MKQTILFQEVINSIAQFVRIIVKILENLLYICRSFLNNIKIKKLKIKYDDEKIFFDIRRFVLKHIKNLNTIFFNFELINCIISNEKSQFCMLNI